MDHTFPIHPVWPRKSSGMPPSTTVRRLTIPSEDNGRELACRWGPGGGKGVDLASPTRSNAVTRTFSSCTAESNDGECGRICRSVGPRTRRTTLYHRTTSHFLCFCCCLSFVFHRYLTSTSFAPVPNPIPSTPRPRHVHINPPDSLSSSIRPPVPVPTLPARNRI